MTTPEAKARANIDAQLAACGWIVQDRAALNRFAGRGVAVREYPLDTGYADYLLFVDSKAAGVIEAKAEGVPLAGVAEQAALYAVGLPAATPHVTLPLPFLYESTGVETFFRDNRDPQPRSRRVFAFHRPETLAEWITQTDTLRARLRRLPQECPLVARDLWPAQVEAITHLKQSLAADPGDYFDLVLTNPPFGKKSSVTFVTDSGEVRRESQDILRGDFWTSTSNKQLNFVQHVRSILKQNGRAAVVVPDNVLFEGGAGESPWTKQLWIYGLRANQNFTLKTNTLTRADLDEFVACYHPENRHERTATWSAENPQGRWRAFSYEELAARDKANLDIFWLRDESLEDSEALPDPDVLAREIVEDLKAALEQFAGIVEELGGEEE